MARNEYYTYKGSPINGDIMMSVQVFDIITKQVAAEDKDIKLDTSKGFSVTGTNSSEPFSFTLVATLLISTDGASATGVSISSLSSTFSGSLSGSVGFVSPVTFTSL